MIRPGRAALAIRLAAAVAVVAVTGAAAPAPVAQTAGRQTPLVLDSMVGRDLFEFYCATCHGRDGRGGGPVAVALKVPPPDLTRLTRRHGVFPRARVEAFVTHDGDAVSAAHGSSDMPVWGPIFRALDPSDTRAAIRIANVVSYIESLQTKGTIHGDHARD